MTMMTVPMMTDALTLMSKRHLKGAEAIVTHANGAIVLQEQRQ